jgi:hypothetical protein
MLRSAVITFSVAATFLAGCGHCPETVVHLTAPTSGSWVVRDHSGARLCALPCTVELETNETVVVGHDGGRGTSFIVHQENLGTGTWSGAIRVQKEQGAGAIALAALSGALVNAGTSLIQTRRDERMATGIVLSGIGTAGMFVSDALPGKTREELWLDRMATTTASRD